MRAHKTGKIGSHRYPEVERMIAAGHSAIAIGTTMSVDPETIRKYARKRHLTIQRHDMTMKNHPCWRTGTVLDRSGYQLQRVQTSSQFGYLIRALGVGRASGYAPTHRIVMHQKLGRPLQAFEVVDHIDGDRTNNDPSNLRVFATNADHLRETLAGKRPKWSADGWARMQFGRPRKHPEPATIADHPKTDDPA